MRQIILAGQQLRLSPGVIALECACGVCNSLDEYSLYLSPSRLEPEQALLKGKLVGIGIELVLVDQQLEVGRVFRKGPAAVVGMSRGDRITRIDGIWVDPLAPDVAAARLLEMVSRGPGGLARLLADVPRTFTTPEIRVECPDEVKFAIAERAAEFFGSRYRVNTIDGVRIAFPDGWGLLRASNTQPVLVMRFEAASPERLAEYQSEITSWLAGQGVLA